MSEIKDIKKILIKYWGYSSFRPLQEDIINSVLEGNDTLALMPTGGGKSITFQVPALAKEGLCIVVTPLIALMQDQVDNLNKRGINAVFINSAMTYREIELALDKCVFGNTKFLYLSPERLHTDIFQTKLKQMNVNLLAIDESHCISQWGYDFRPAYLKIADIREIIPDTPVLAVTASATKKVADDIMDKLKFKTKVIFRKSFERKNLIYIVKETENKFAYLLRTIKHVGGTGIVYVRNRRKTVEIAQYLQRNKIKADFYHAGLDSRVRNYKQDAWINNKIQIIVSTNAFGMGIDKPDVRFVVHLDLPDSLEAYYQEAGRGGRDEKKAFAIVLFDNSDVENLRNSVARTFPPVEQIYRTYNALGNFLNIPVGAGKGAIFKFNFTDFVNRYNLPVLETYNSLKIIQQIGLIQSNDAFYSPAKIKFLTDKTELYKFQVANPSYDPFIKLILRSYSGVFTEYTAINEKYMAQSFMVDVKVIKKYLSVLSKHNIIDYIPESNSPTITFIEERLPENSNFLNFENYGSRKQNYIEKIDSVITYVTSTAKCRSQIILEYFDEENTTRCGTCDVCRKRNELKLSRYEFDLILKELKILIPKEKPLLNEAVEKINYPSHKVIKVINWLFENNKVRYDNTMHLIWNK